MTKAAQKLYMAQPAVSRMIAELEAHYKVRLFDRMDRRLYLTGWGRQMWEDAKTVLLSVERMESRLEHEMVAPVLRVGCSLGIGISFIQDYLERYYAQYPETKIHICENHSTFIEEQVALNELDIGVIETGIKLDSLVAVPFREDDLVAVCAPSHPLAGYARGRAARPLTLGELNEAGLCLPVAGTGTRNRLEQEARTAGIELAPIWSTINFAHIVEQTREGRAVSILSRHLVDRGLRAGDLLELETDFRFRRTFHIIWHKNKYLPVNGRYFVSLWQGTQSQN